MAKLRQADLRIADLGGANFGEADVSGADFEKANLRWANLRGADLKNANLSNAKCGYTIFANLSLSLTKGLDAMVHTAPSTIGVDTLYLSHWKIPGAFMKGCGVPDSLIGFDPPLIGSEYYSCFISYSHKDEEVAKGSRKNNFTFSTATRCNSMLARFWVWKGRERPCRPVGLAHRFCISF